MRDGLRSRSRSKGGVEGEGKGKKGDGVAVTNGVELLSNVCEELSSNGSLAAVLVPQVRVEEAFAQCEVNGDDKTDDPRLPDGGVSVNGEKVDSVKDSNCNVKKVDGVDAANCNGEQVNGVASDNCNGEQENGVGSDNCNGEQLNGVASGNCNGEQENGVGSDNCNGELANGVDSDNCNGEQTVSGNTNNGIVEKVDDVQTKGRRGRKRKNSQVSSNAERLEMIDLNEMPVVQISRRVLRPRTLAVDVKDLAKGDLNDMDEETDEGVDEKLKLENAEDKNVESSKRGMKKKVKGRRGRPPRVNVENIKSTVVIVKKDKVLGSKVCLKSDTSLSKLKSEAGASEKKDIRNQLLDIILRCGWEIQLVPRASRNYKDPVYVNPEGTTHWSITKAYKNLTERIDSGVANAVEKAGFTVIPDETLSKLFRNISKRRSDFGVKRSEGVEDTETGKKRACTKKIDDAKREEKTNTGKKSCGRKRKSVLPEGRKKRRFALLARGSGNTSDPDDNESELYNKKRNLLSWMIDLGTIPEGATVQYRDPVKGTDLIEGKVTHDGLSCNCCNKVYTISGFQLHAGSKMGEPLKNLYLDSGLSLLQCMVDSWSQQVELCKIGFCSVDVAAGDNNDDTCNMCGDGGDLMCCDRCPSTFHLSCLDIENVPAGDWLCMYCTCKFCGSVDDESLSDADGHHLITCQLCEEKFHSTCTDQTDAKSLNSATASFCGDGCHKIYNSLQKFIGLKHEIEGGLSWTILRQYNVANDASQSDYPLKIECNAKLAVAYSVMDECFLPVVDPRSQSDMITNVIYNCGSDFKRLNYSGFHTFILEKGDEVVCTASVRFHGRQLAEMPFVATRNIYRRQGLSRQLITVIEKVLSSMDIQKLIIPAVSDVMAMWTDSFGFVPLEETTWQEMKTMSIIAFPHTDMLQKPLPQATGYESEPIVPEVKKPFAEAYPENEMLESLVDGKPADDSEEKTLLYG